MLLKIILSILKIQKRTCLLELEDAYRKLNTKNDLLSKHFLQNIPKFIGTSMAYLIYTAAHIDCLFEKK